MKKPETQNWPKNIEAYSGLLLFAQSWEEMLFDYTLDSYKPRRFNILGLCSELIEAFDNLESNNLRANSITPIVEELLYVLDDDTISKNALGTKCDLLKTQIKQWNEEKPNKKVAYAASTIYEIIRPILKTKLSEELQKVVTDPRKPIEISDFASRLLTEILRQGYSPNHIYYSVQNFFFRNNPITSHEDLVTFLSFFNGIDHTYEVTFKMNKDCEVLARNFDDDYIKTSRKLEQRDKGNAYEKAFIESIKPSEVFVTMPKIETKDRYSARREAEQRVDVASLLTGFFNHKICVDLNSDALVVEENKKPYFIGQPVKPTMKRSDAPDNTIEQAMGELFKPIFSTQDPDLNTISRLGSALRAHSIAIDAKIIENQFSSLWTALETITTTAATGNIIKSIISSAVPVLSLKYFLKLVVELRNDIRKCIPLTWTSVCTKKQAGESEIEFLVRLLSAEAAKPLREELYSACSNNPLLRHRISRFHDYTFRSLHTTRTVLNSHEKRITWHLQRLYRARNTLLHVGAAYETLDLLVENLHDYFDHIMTEVAERLNPKSRHITIEQVFFEYDIEYKAYLKMLQESQTGLTRQEIAKLIVFGNL
jgi:hypothetical protein